MYIKMTKQTLLFGLLSLFAMAVISKAQDCNAPIPDKDNAVRENFLRETPIDLQKSLQEQGIELNMSSTNIYQNNVHGGLSTHRRAGRFSGSYDVEVTTDLQKWLGPGTGMLYIHGEGGWPDTEGIDEVSVGSHFGVNADTIGNRAMDIVELFYEGPLFSPHLNLMAGKLDFTAIFDRTAYADDECTQFINGAFVDNPSIPFTDYSLGTVLTWDIAEQLYVSAGIADAQADGRETGFDTTFHHEDFFLYMLETGLTTKIYVPNGPLTGNYRIGLWYEPQDKGYFSDTGKTRRDDTGYYASCDQLLYKENNKPGDNQGLGLFGRYGWSDSEVEPAITSFFSAGAQYQGLLISREQDILGIGFAHGTFTDKDKITFAQDYESVLELYYNAEITPSLHISPDIQYVTNPGGTDNAQDAFIIALRIQMKL